MPYQIFTATSWWKVLHGSVRTGAAAACWHFVNDRQQTLFASRVCTETISNNTCWEGFVHRPPWRKVQRLLLGWTRFDCCRLFIQRMLPTWCVWLATGASTAQVANRGNDCMCSYRILETVSITWLMMLCEIIHCCNCFFHWLVKITMATPPTLPSNSVSVE